MKSTVQVINEVIKGREGVLKKIVKIYLFKTSGYKHENGSESRRYNKLKMKELHNGMDGIVERIIVVH